MDYTADPGESNQIVFTVNDAGEPTFEVRDAPGVNIAAQSPCFNFGANNVMDCPQDGNGSGAITLLTASLGDGNDTITLLANLPTSIGAGGGADTMNGGPAADFLRGGQQDDLVNGGGGADQIVGDDPGTDGGGNDQLDGEGGNDSIDGQDGNDTIAGGDGNDALHGGNGGDVLVGDLGADTLNGDSGIDRAFYA